MNHRHLSTLLRQGLSALDQEKTSSALVHFEEAARWRPSATALSCLGYCLARERRDLKEALVLCEQAVRMEPANPLHYLNLGRVYQLSGQKALAISAFHRGLQFGRHPGIIRALQRIGRRRAPVFSFLGRTHIFNRSIGFFLSCLGLR